VVLSARITIDGVCPEVEALAGVARSFDRRSCGALTLRCAQQQSRIEHDSDERQVATECRAAARMRRSKHLGYIWAAPE